MKNKGVRRLTKLRVLRMGIKFTCPQCGKWLNVKSNLAGRRGLCPHCRGKVEIPSESAAEDSIPLAQAATSMPTAPRVGTGQSATGQSSTGQSATGQTPTRRNTPSTSVTAFEDLDPNSFLLDRPVVELTPSPQTHFDWIADAPDAVWYVRNRAGGQYGPAVGSIMRTWLQEGRVSRECYVWREGWAHWRQASDVFPHTFEPLVHGSPPAPAAAAAPWHPSARPAPAAAAPRSTSPVPTTTTSISSETQPALSSPSRRNSATWLFVAILAMVLTVSGVAITGVVYMIKKSNEVKAPNEDAPPVEIRDPFS